jgi:uncharacterized repeat protein (TIGR03803 family)
MKKILWIIGSILMSQAGYAQQLWGMTELGGANNQGVLFEYNAGTNIYTKILDFNGTANGSYPQGSLAKTSNTLFYGMTNAGGVNNMGVLFQYNLLTNTYTKKVDFAGTTNGKIPRGSLMLASNGKFYGMTSQGGANNLGILFQYNPVTDTFTKKIDFSGLANGSYPSGSLMQAADGNLYGMTQGGGANNMGVLFQYMINTNTLTIKFDFSTPNGMTAISTLMQATDGNLYGMTSQGGTLNGGVLFQYNFVTNTFTKKMDFSPPIAKGKSPLGFLIQALDGNLYGLTNSGGATDNGVLFQYNPTTDVYTKKIDFSFTLGQRPYGSLEEGTDGNLYGMTSIFFNGADFGGSLFQYAPNTNSFMTKFSFNGTSNGGNAYGDLMDINSTRSAILPVELIYFKGHVLARNEGTEGGNLLTWQTASEINSAYFDIERSANLATNDFEKIGQIQASNKPNTYQFTDKQPFRTTYYRLRQSDKDGKIHFSKIIALSLKSSNGLKIYPTLVDKGVLNLITEGVEQGGFSIFNLLGQCVQTGKVGTQIDVSALPQGTFILKIGTEQAKFIIK